MRLFIVGLLVTVLAPALGWSQLRIPNRPEPLFKGTPGKQRTEVYYDAATDTVSVKFAVQDPNGYFIPKIRRENFVVYEDGVQNIASITVEHAPVSVALLLEHGGRHAALNRDVADEVSRSASQFLDVLDPADAVAIWTYADSVTQLAGFTRNREPLSTALLTSKPPALSETNLYDALIFAINRMHQVTGRKAILLVTSGVDTFSRATYADVLNAARHSDTPIYVLSLGPALKEDARLLSLTPKIDWDAGEKQLEQIAKESGARLYSFSDTMNLAGIYSDIIENLKVRYVITYHPANHGNPSAAHTVRVALIETGTGNPLRIQDENGRAVHANVIAEGSYTQGQEHSAGHGRRNE
jgi:Ca-activated chloride channel family protein